VGLAIAVAAGLATVWLMRRAAAPPPAVEARPPAKAVNAADVEVATLRQNLRLKVMYDEAKIDRLIEFERGQAPFAGLGELMRKAIQRWERDNR
jgi:hypothetical protein